MRRWEPGGGRAAACCLCSDCSGNGRWVERYVMAVWELAQ